MRQQPGHKSHVSRETSGVKGKEWNIGAYTQELLGIDANESTHLPCSLAALVTFNKEAFINGKTLFEIGHSGNWLK